eukprot:gnl/Spiro4/13264_TR7042_c0_g1_i1.p1 gnl/Spiro4/13264_TR7042_c0_g1~~gnl/Spiro4/13264_TR7042_c0_g1_i1.p1  ORF type:complete len:843 (-),score=142.66 gnl/Spiro4/13264_TR7042_c0_g1_i1:57-2585(-)
MLAAAVNASKAQAALSDQELCSLDLGGAANALSASPDGARVCVGGRDVLKIIGIYRDENRLDTLRNMRRIGRTNLSFSTNDVRWHPSNPHLIATAATNGAVVVWNVERMDAYKKEREFTEHTRTVNNVCWHPSDASLLISGSMDRTIKLWDIRTPTGACLTFCGGVSEPVRRVEMHPTQPHFAAALETGPVQLWDIRSNRSFERQLVGHSRMVPTLDWHPTRRDVLLSGSQDRTVMIWDTAQSASTRAQQCVQTIASVNFVKWRPGMANHFASSASMMDFRIHVWSTLRPFIPIMSFEGHKDAATGFLFVHGDPDTVLSCSKDGRLLMHRTKNSYRPLKHVCTRAAAWTARGDLNVISDTPNRISAGDELPTEPLYPALPFSGQGLVHVLRPPNMDGVFNATSFISLAKTYRLDSGVNFGAVCEHNAAAAFAEGRKHASEVWRMLVLLYEPEDVPPESPRSLVPHVPLDINEADTQVVESSDPPFSPRDDEFLDDFVAFMPFLGLREPTEHFALPALSPEGLSSSASSRPGVLDMATPGTLNGPIGGSSNASGSGSALNASAVKSLVRESSASSSSAMVALLGDTAPTTASSSSLGRHSAGGGGGSTDAVPAGAVTAPGMRDRAPAPHTLAHTSTFTLVSRPPRVSSHGKLDGEMLDLLGTSALATAALGGGMSTLTSSIVSSFFEYFCSEGDVQMCVAMASVLRGRYMMDRKRMQLWLCEYIDLLQRLRQHTLVADVINQCSDELVRSMSQASTTVPTSCSACGKPLLDGPAWFCKRCNDLVNGCSICRLPVTGLYSWCSGCGHGGHLAHMQAWFKAGNATCPTGCGHVCNANVFPDVCVQ